MKSSAIILSIASAFLGACTAPVRVGPVTMVGVPSQKQGSRGSDGLVEKPLGPESLAGDFIASGTGSSVKIVYPLPNLTHPAADDASSIHFTGRDESGGSVAPVAPPKQEPGQTPAPMAATPSTAIEAHQP